MFVRCAIVRGSAPDLGDLGDPEKCRSFFDAAALNDSDVSFAKVLAHIAISVARTDAL